MSILSVDQDKQLQSLERPNYVTDDEYLRSIDGMVQSIKDVREEPESKGVTLDKLDWWLLRFMTQV